MNGQIFGLHVRGLRRARGLTQEVLAERSSLSADTIRRLEHGSFSPSLDTLLKLSTGLDLLLSTLFSALELGESDVGRELLDLLSVREPRELALAMQVLRLLFAEMDGLAVRAANYPPIADDNVTPEDDDEPIVDNDDHRPEFTD